MALPKGCPLCGAGTEVQSVVTHHVYGDAEGGRAFFHCSRCDVRYMHPGLTPEQETRFYAGEFEAFMATRAGTGGGWSKVEDHVRASESTRLRRMRYLEPHLPPGASVLEIGCSSGFMLLPLRAQGHPCVGVEPSGAFGAHLRSQGLEVHDSLDDLVRAMPTQRFDLIMHFFVLEHIARPAAFLERLLDLLKPAGRIVFEVPNAADPLYSVYDIPAFERFYWSIAHPWYFSEPSLGYLLERCGRPFTIAREQRYDLSNHMVWARDGRPGGAGRFTGLLGRELEDAYRRGLIAAGRCDTLIGIVGQA